VISPDAAAGVAGTRRAREPATIRRTRPTERERRTETAHWHLSLEDVGSEITGDRSGMR